jgi:hypothetical protein
MTAFMPDGTNSLHEFEKRVKTAGLNDSQAVFIERNSCISCDPDLL